MKIPMFRVLAWLREGNTMTQWRLAPCGQGCYMETRDVPADYDGPDGPEDFGDPFEQPDPDAPSPIPWRTCGLPHPTAEAALVEFLARRVPCYYDHEAVRAVVDRWQHQQSMLAAMDREDYEDYTDYLARVCA